MKMVKIKPCMLKGKITDIKMSDTDTGAMWLAAGAIGCDISCPSAHIGMSEVIKKMGGSIRKNTDGTFSARYKATMHGITVKLSEIKEIYHETILVMSFCHGISTINKISKSNNGEFMTILSEMSKLGVYIKLEKDKVLIYGRYALCGADVMTHGSFKTAMMLAIAASRTEGNVRIKNTEKFSEFFEVYEKLGGIIKKI